MFGALVIIGILPIVDLIKLRGFQFRPIIKIAFVIFVANFIALDILGAKHVESPYIELGQLSTIVYFGFFIILVPVISLIENTLLFISSNFNNNIKLSNSLSEKK
jgi:ubiquinol-cytochrome c reductase cytochrome b subunit